jgi:hypothetical protein
MNHVATVHAYKNTDGLFNAAMTIENKATVYVENCETFEVARYSAKMLAWEAIGKVRYAPINIGRGRYKANVWH